VEFRQLCSLAAELCANYLASLDSRAITPGLTGEQVERMFRGDCPEQGIGAAAFDALREVLAASRAQNGRFFGYVLGSGEPVGAVADLVASVANQNVTAWRSSPAAVTIEQKVVGWIARAIGCREFSGSFTGGGSAANLMALAIARESTAPANEAGVQSGIVYCSTEAHMSIPKAVALLGIGRRNLRYIAVDEQHRMRVDELERALEGDAAAGKRPVAVVASAGTVNTGAIDPLAEIAAVAHRHGAWYHVDGAYGALAAIAVPEKFRGLDQADSLSLDPHKWLYQPLDCGCLLYRDANTARAAFSHTGDYAKSLSDDSVEGFAFFEESMELSRRFRALKLWTSLRYHGLAAFRDSIRQDLALAQRLARNVAKQADLELLAPVELSAVCFRYRGGDPARLDAINEDILRRVVRRGRVYISNATLAGRFALRACVTNHRSTEADVDEVVAEVLRAATEIAK
jgi:glutamate/tyrosine decarboxylase-like PLP-dependent enzyme